MVKKGQAAMEFLMTYGWAILVVIVAIAALAYFGVRNPGRFLPESCNIAPGFSCNFQIQTSQVTVSLQNGLGQDLTNFYVNVSLCGNTAGSTVSFLDGTNRTWPITCGSAIGTVGQRFKSDISVVYTDDNGYGRVRTGQIIGKIE